MRNRTETSRANGARSNGPISQEGKAKSALNAIKHGLTSNKVVVLQNENPQDYARLAADFADTFHPANLAEGSLVQEMVNSRWKRVRAEAIETGLIDLALCAVEPNSAPPSKTKSMGPSRSRSPTARTSRTTRRLSRMSSAKSSASRECSRSRTTN